MSSHIDFWNKLNHKQAAKSPHYKTLFQSLQTIRPGSVLLFALHQTNLGLVN